MVSASNFKSVPVSIAFDVDQMGICDCIRSALEAIDTVHQDGNLPRIYARRADIGKEQGHYRKDSEGNVLGIIVNTFDVPLPNLTFVHEVGHFLDDQSIDVPGSFASINSPQTTHWRNVIDNTSAVKHLRSLVNFRSLQYDDDNDETITHTIQPEVIDYLLRYEELFARSYAQFIAHKSQNEDLMQSIAWHCQRRLAQVYPVQWQNDDFQPVASALEDLFKRLGWMQ